VDAKTMKTKIIILLSIFLVTVIPIIYVYYEHAFVEYDAWKNATTETKKIKTLGESLLFSLIGLGYVITTIFIILTPQYRIPYLVVIVGTVAVVILYYFRIYGIPIPFTEGIVITDLSSDWRDVVTKICQQILVIPVSMLLILKTFNRSHKTHTL
jgi:hypothetical protein